MENNNLLTQEESDSDSLISKACMLFGTICSIIFSIGLLSYIVCSIAFLIGDYKLSSAYSNCYLWEYTLAYILLILFKLFLYKYDSCVFSIKFCNCLIMLLIELTYFIFGYSQLGFMDTICDELHGSNIWYVGVCSLIIQIIISGIYSYFLLVFIYVEICKIKTPCCCTQRNM